MAHALSRAVRCGEERLIKYRSLCVAKAGTDSGVSRAMTERKGQMQNARKRFAVLDYIMKSNSHTQDNGNLGA